MATVTPFLRRTNTTSQTSLSGTLSSTSGSKTVTGSSTDFTNELNAGDLIELDNDGDHLTIDTVDSGTQLTLLDNAPSTHSGVSGQRDKNEYLFLPMEVQNWDFENNPLELGLPGNDETDLSGETGTKFLVNLGTQGSKIRAAGVLVGVDSSELPSLNLSDEYFNATSTTSSAPSLDGSDLRNALSRYVAAQASIDVYRRHMYGWPDWHSSFTSADSDGDTLDSTNYRLWEGNARNVQTEEKAGEPNQFQYSFRWIVARND